MAFVTRASALEKLKPVFFDVEVEELGGTVKVRRLTGAEQLEVDKAQFKAAKDKEHFDMTLECLAKSLCDEDGEPLFPGDQGVKDLGKLPEAVIQKLNLAVTVINRVPNQDAFYETLKKTIGDVATSTSVES